MIAVCDWVEGYEIMLLLIGWLADLSFDSQIYARLTACGGTIREVQVEPVHFIWKLFNLFVVFSPIRLYNMGRFWAEPLLDMYPVVN